MCVRRRTIGAAAAQLGQHGTEAVFFQESRQGLVRRFLQREFVQWRWQRQVILQAHQFARQPGHFNRCRQRLLQLGLPDRLDVGNHAFHAAIFTDQLRRGFRANTLHAGDIVGRVAHQRQHLAHLFGRHAELLDHLGAVDGLVLHRVEHIDAGFDQLHQILIGTDNGYIHASGTGSHRVTGDDVVRLHPSLFEAGHRKGPHRIADQRELRDQVLRRRGAVGLVLIIHVVAEGVAAGIEHDGKMGRRLRLVQVGNQLPQHRREAIDGAHRHALRVCQRRQPMIGAEDEAGAVDKIEMLLRHAHDASSMAAMGRERR